MVSHALLMLLVIPLLSLQQKANIFAPQNFHLELKKGAKRSHNVFSATNIRPSGLNLCVFSCPPLFYEGMI